MRSVEGFPVQALSPWITDMELDGEKVLQKAQKGPEFDSGTGSRRLSFQIKGIGPVDSVLQQALTLAEA